MVFKNNLSICKTDSFKVGCSRESKKAKLSGIPFKYNLLIDPPFAGKRSN